jgi:hypothetical protein
MSRPHDLARKGVTEVRISSALARRFNHFLAGVIAAFR